MNDPVEFLFVDESGDPGLGGTPIFLMTCIQVDLVTLNAVQAHLVNFRYHHGITTELKDLGALLKDHPTRMTRSLLRFLVDLTGPTSLRATTNWVDKASYAGPHLGSSQPHWFQNYQLRRLLGRHQSRHGWGDNTDLVMDRRPMSDRQLENLTSYIRSGCDLAPPPTHLTVADSCYVPLIDLADFYTRLVRHVVEGGKDPEYGSFVSALTSVKQITKGLY